jgi:hypothetical protein
MKFVGFHILFKSIDFAKLATATTNGLKKIKFYCAHYFTPMVFFNSKNILRTSYVSCTQRGRGGGVGKSFGYHKPFPKLGLKPAPTWEEIHPFVGEQKWLVSHLTF